MLFFARRNPKPIEHHRRAVIADTVHKVRIYDKNASYVLRSPECSHSRTAYVKEAARFKSTLPDVNDPARNEQVIHGAVDAAPAVHLPQIVAQFVYEGIINSSVPFEECIVRATRFSGVIHS